jgi:hypothetical protein
MEIGHLTQKAHPVLSWFVIACCVVTVGLLYVMQKTYAAADAIAEKSGYSQYMSE